MHFQILRTAARNPVRRRGPGHPPCAELLQNLPGPSDPAPPPQVRSDGLQQRVVGREGRAPAGAGRLACPDHHDRRRGGRHGPPLGRPGVRGLGAGALRAWRPDEGGDGEDLHLPEGARSGGADAAVPLGGPEAADHRHVPRGVPPDVGLARHAAGAGQREQRHGVRRPRHPGRPRGQAPGARPDHRDVHGRAVRAARADGVPAGAARGHRPQPPHGRGPSVQGDRGRAEDGRVRPPDHGLPGRQDLRQRARRPLAVPDVAAVAGPAPDAGARGGLRGREDARLGDAGSHCVLLAEDHGEDRAQGRRL
mmetsp:Transcript_75965/g.127687  ORF Transcript_75965/g.127687 Transcript_75965/m.127687 type:complete len:308 (-) Transcript_75965:543-1466(-)